MLKLELWYFGHLMQRADSLEKTLMLGKIEGRRRRGDRGWDGWMASPSQWTWVWASSGRWWQGRTGKPGVLQSMGSQRVGQDWATEQQPRKRKISSWKKKNWQLPTPRGYGQGNDLRPRAVSDLQPNCTTQSPVYHHHEGPVTWVTGWGWALSGGRSVRDEEITAHAREEIDWCGAKKKLWQSGMLRGFLWVRIQKSWCVCVCVVTFYSLCLRCLLCKKQPHLLDWIVKIYISTHVVLRTRPAMKYLMPTA